MHRYNLHEQIPIHRAIMLDYVVLTSNIVQGEEQEAQQDYTIGAVQATGMVEAEYKAALRFPDTSCTVECLGVAARIWDVEQ